MKKCTLPETNIAMENPQFWWYLPGKMGFSWAMLVSGRVWRRTKNVRKQYSQFYGLSPHFHHPEKKNGHRFFFTLPPQMGCLENVTNPSFVRFLGFYGPIPFRRRARDRWKFLRGPFVWRVWKGTLGLTSWWLNQPVWKILVKLDHFPR